MLPKQAETKEKTKHRKSMKYKPEAHERKFKKRQRPIFKHTEQVKISK